MPAPLLHRSSQNYTVLWLKPGAAGRDHSEVCGAGDLDLGWDGDLCPREGGTGAAALGSHVLKQHPSARIASCP